MLNKNIEKILNHALSEANQARHEFFTLEHLLLALCQKDRPTREALVELGADLTEIVTNLLDFIDKNMPRLFDDAAETQSTAAFRRVIEHTSEQRRAAEKNSVSGLHLVIGLFEENESHAIYYLKKQGIKKLELMHLVSRLDNEPDESNGGTASAEKNKNDPLKNYCSNLNELAKQGLIDPLIGREEELQRTLQILSRRRKNNPILVGEAGVGKTAIAEGLAKKIVDGDVPALLRKTEIYSVDLGSMVAGSKYRGDFEKRVKALVEKLATMKDTIIFIDEIHTLLGAGSTSDGTMDASNLLKPALSAGTLRCIGATTYKEYKNSFEKNAALARRFQKIDILEPSKTETVHIIKGLLSQFETFHQVKYVNGVVEQAVDLADKYIHDRHLPDKAIDLIDEAGAKAKIQTPPKKRITGKDIEWVVAKIAKIPEKSISSNDKKLLKGLERRLKQRVFGQDKAITTLTAAIKLSRAGLKDLEKPIGAFLFTGPTGVGKTEVSRCLSDELNIPMLRFDMSEYMESHSVARLIGSPPGYVGYEQGGLLTDAVANTPHCVLLLDEIEKAHPDIFNLLLQVMDYGSLTDNNGKKVNFSNVILIMTSNVGAAAQEKNKMGFANLQAVDYDAMPAIKKAFTPEFRNRLSDTIQFTPLSEAVVLKIIDKLIAKLADKLTPQQVHISLKNSAKQWLLARGYNPLMGARPMSRLIDSEITTRLSEEILFGNLRKGGTVTVDVDKRLDTLLIHTEKQKEATPA